ncbi:hypothetical protein CSHISOI_09457 [Colletotrichum shisoi]|uniref:Zn(2)-C6 fungal-type domain-containing protein n=1 Tax=Colletotrichum shisoi TaxID=2078593 RepID=A0A5Q4BGQ5_9PEZI|nr:hypothetical protein CSHISOI_09457 [Colletotrichum shisoi]
MRMPANENTVAVAVAAAAAAAVTVAADNRPAAATTAAAVADSARGSSSPSEAHRPASATSTSITAALPPLSSLPTPAPAPPPPPPPPTSVPSMPLTLSRLSRHDAALVAGRLEPYSFTAQQHPPPPPPSPTYYRRLAAAPGPGPGHGPGLIPGPASAPKLSPNLTQGPAPPSATASSAARHGLFRLPPSPSPTPSHPNTFKNLAGHERNHSSSSFASTNNSFAATSAPRPDTSQPGRCSVMALQNVLCDPDDDVIMTSSRSSHPPTPPDLDALNAPTTTASAPISPASDPLETPAFVARPNPSHVVMTTRPQLHTPHTQHNEPGCKTCQIRKMPCDEGRPSCQNCSRMGIHCLGYFSPSHANAQQVPDRSVPSVSANAKRQDQEEYLFFLLDHYRHTKRHCMWELITLDFNEHFSCNMRKEALQMIKRRRFKDKE